ncbi:MAG: cupin domain-containing protein [Desulfuromonas sp.]|nr:MAG: cupin domain-containing protein [Desulfuromonas sp.]
MFRNHSPEGYHQVLDKIELKTLAFGEKTLLSEFRLRKGAKLPSHSHPHEQTGYLVSGLLELTIGGETFLAEPGAAWSVPPDVEHSGVAKQACVAIEVFSPPREDYLKLV